MRTARSHAGRPGLRVPLVLAAGMAAAAAVSAQVFRATTDLVTVDVLVQAGRAPVGGLVAGDFDLRDNGVPQTVELAAAETLPLDVTLLLDASRSVSGVTLERLKAATRQAAAMLGGHDRLRLIRLSNRLGQVFDFQSPAAPLPLDGLVAEGATSLYDGLAAAMMTPREGDRRHLILALTDGRDTLSFLDADTAARVARAADAVVHVVVSVSPESAFFIARASRSRDRRAVLRYVPNGEALEAIAGAAGGAVLPVDASQPIADAFRAVLAEFRTGYVLMYSPRGVPRAGWHDITVTVVKPGLPDVEVRARKGYLANDSGRGGRR